MMVNNAGGKHINIEQDANRIEMVAKRISSPSRMEARNVIADMQEIIDAARRIIENAEVIKIANLPKGK